MDDALKQLIGGPGEGTGSTEDFIGRVFAEPAQADGAQEDPPQEAVEPEPPKEDAPKKDDVVPDFDDGQEEEVEEPELGDAKAGEAFKRLKGELKEYKAKEKELAAKVEEAERRAAEIEAKLQRAQELAGGDDFEASLSELKKRASVLDLEGTKEWQENVEQPLSHVMATVKKVADAWGIDEADIHAVFMEKNIRKQGEKLEDLASDLDSKSKRALFQAVDDYQLVMEKKAELEEDAERTLTAIRENDRSARERAEREKKEVLASKADSIAAELRGKLGGFESAIDESVAAVKRSLVDGISDDSQAYAALSGTLLPKVYKALLVAQKEAAEYKATVDRYKAGSPASKGEGKASEPGSKAMSIKDIIDPNKPSTLLEGLFT